jgi:hypothetical protein
VLRLVLSWTVAGDTHAADADQASNGSISPIGLPSGSRIIAKR